MATQSQSSTRKSNTFRRLKQYRCQGFGDCEMVFSRSEHLARHIRKHTGEKPFKCESPDCNKSFSRFDNMRQHAQTHLRFRKHNCKRPDGVQIQPRLSDSSQPITLGDGQVLSQKPIVLSATKQGESAQASVAKKQTTLGCGGHDNTTGTDSSPALPYYSATSNNSQNGLVSPVSMSGTFDEQQHQYCKQEVPCCKQGLDSLTQDELDALDGLNQFQQSPLATSGTTTEVMVKAESN